MTTAPAPAEAATENRWRDLLREGRGPLLALIFPISPLSGGAYLGKAFVVCVLGGLGSVPGALVGGLTLGLAESFGALWLGPEHASTLSFVLLIAILLVRPEGLLGRKGYA